MKPELLVVGPTYMFSVNRRKLQALAQHFKVTCATSRLPDAKLFGRPVQEYEETGAEEAFELHRFPEVPNSKKFTRVFYQGLGSLFRRHQFDFVLVESEPWAFLKWQVMLLTKRFQQHAVFGEFSWENVERPGLTGLILSLTYRLSSRLEDFCISGNYGSRRIFLKYGTPSSRNLVAAQLGVDTNLFRPASREERIEIRRGLGLPENAFIIGFCGRLTAEKGLSELAGATRRLYDEDKGVLLALLGDGPLFAELVSHGFATVLPGRPHSAIAPFMQALDLFVLPSKPLRGKGRVWEEQFGHVLIEAIACGVPTLGSDSGAIPEVLANPESIFPHSDADAIYQKLRQAVTSPDWLSQLASSQRKRVENVYSHEAVARTYAEFLMRIRDEKISVQ